MPRDPLAPVSAAAAELKAAGHGIELAKVEARALVQAARERERQARATLHERVVEAGRRGVRQVDLIAAAGLTRETIRRVLRAGGVTAD